MSEKQKTKKPSSHHQRPTPSEPDQQKGLVPTETPPKDPKPVAGEIPDKVPPPDKTEKEKTLTNKSLGKKK